MTGNRNTRRKRLLFITQWFDPEPIPKGLSFAQALYDRGFDVDVLTGFPNYPDGEVYEGYSLRPYQREMHNGVVVHRTILFPSHDRSSVSRAANYLSFALSSLLAGLTKIPRPDVVYAYHPPATVGGVGVLLARRFDVPLVIDVQDLWPDTVLSSGMMANGLAMRILSAACRWEYLQGDRVTVSSDKMVSILSSRGVAPERLSVIYNWADEARIGSQADPENVAKAQAAVSGAFSVLFAGQMGEAQGLDNVLEAAALAPSIRWILMGGGTDRVRLERVASERGLGNVRFVNRVPMQSVGAWLDAADGLLVHLSDDPLYTASIPSKTQAYMLAARPVLMVASGAAADLVEAAKAGVICPPANPRALANAAEHLAKMSQRAREQLGINGRKYYESELSFSVGVDRFAKIFRDLIDA